MKVLNRLLACMLVLTFLIAYFPMEVFAVPREDSIVSINNGYVKFSINKRTGGFSISTLEGHPQKRYDNNIPLLFKEDTNSTETSFTTVRIDGEDYIFGQDYGWFGINSKLYEPVVSDVDKTIITKWVIKGIEITQKIALSTDKNNDLSGNTGIAYEIKNTNAVPKEVAIRTLLDTALGELDAPYMIAGYETLPTIIEREFVGDDVPDQIRGLDSLTNPAMINYSILKGWSDGAAPNKVIIGHWGNLANTRFDYTPNKNCDFSNYSSAYKTPDSALAFYWDKQELAPNTTRKAEFLYGIGNFSSQLVASNVNINMDVDRVYTTKDKKGYENNGIFDVRVEIDNTVDNAKDIGFATLSLSLEEGLSIVEEDITGDYNLVTQKDLYIENIPAGTIAQRYWRIKANPQTGISAKEISVSIHTTTTDPVTASRYVILPSATGSLPNISFDTVTPNKFYFMGDKNINITGNLDAFKSLSGKTGWDLYLRHVVTGDLTKIEKDQIAFTGDKLNTLSFTTGEELTVGEYEIVFHFTDNQLVEDFTSEITVKQRVEVNLDKALENKSYGIVTVLRYDTDKYKLITFRNEEELIKYRNDNKLNNFYCNEQEMILEVRGKIQGFREEGGDNLYYAANPSTSEVTINNVVQYKGSEPLILKSDNKGNIKVSGNGEISVVDNFVFWNSGFNILFKTGLIHTLAPEKITFTGGQVREVLIEYTGIGKIIQNIHGTTIDLKYGVFTENWKNNTNQGREGFTINFGGKIMLSFLKDKDKDKKGKTGTGSTPGDKGKNQYDEGSVTADIENILYGEDADKVDFLGINATAKLVLPKKVFGGFIDNPPGIYGELTVNTLDNIYAVGAGVKLKVIECTGELRLKFVEVNGVMTAIPDKLYFYLSNERGVPIVPPTLYLTALGGGYDNLADSLTGNYVGSLPPITLLADAGIKVVEVLNGDFSLALDLSGMTLAGVLSPHKYPKMTITTGIDTRWVEPWHLSMYGDIDVFETIRGGISITIANDYFYGYGYVKIFIPKDIPIVGGKELANIEAAVSKTMIGMNIKVLFVKLGVAYYWDSGDVDFGDTIDLGGMNKAKRFGKMDSAMYVEEAPFGSQDKPSVAMYGTNVKRLTSSHVEESPGDIRRMLKSYLLASTYTSRVQKDLVCAGSDALIFAIPYESPLTANKDDITLTNPEGKQITLSLDESLEGGEEGNFLVQSLDGNSKIIFISVVDASYIKDGIWTISSYDEAIVINDFEVNDVQNIPELKTINLKERTDNTSNTLDVSWDFKSEGSKLDNATVDIYLTENKNAYTQSKENGTVNAENLGICIGQFPSRNKKATVNIPDTLNSGTYYMIAVLTLDDCGPSILTCDSKIVFDNKKLPDPVEAVAIEYGGNGAIKVNITDRKSYDYTHYNVFITDMAGNIIKNAGGYYSVGEEIVLGGIGILEMGKEYKAYVQTVREKDNIEYTGNDKTYSNAMTVPQLNMPSLLSMETNVNNTMKYAKNGELKLKYVFDQDVNLEVFVNNLDYINSNEYKNEWEFDTNLPDGEYIVSIRAVNRSGDSYESLVSNTRTLLANNPSINPILAFTVDTTIPVLRIGSFIENSIEGNTEAKISKQTVWLKNGILSLSGMTEAGSEILLDGSSKGIKVQSDGTFEIERAVSLEGAIKKTMALTVTDKAGNINSTTIYAVDGEVSALEALNIKLEEKGILKDIKMIDGIKTIEMKTGDRIQFSAVNTYKMSDNSTKEYGVLPEQLDWSVIYGSNLIDFYEGAVYAKVPGEVVVKGGTLSVGFKETQDVEEKLVSTEDVVIIKITGDPIYRVPVEDTDVSSGRNRATPLAAALEELIAEIGRENILKTVSLQSSRQESFIVNDFLKVIVPIYAVDSDDILVIYKPRDVDGKLTNADGTPLGNPIAFRLVSGKSINKPIILEYDYSGDDVTQPQNVGFYKYNSLFDKWEYVLGKNNTVAMMLTVEASEADEIYLIISNPNFIRFNDVLGHWAEKYIYGLSSLSVINGVKDGDAFKFYPNREITRAEFIKLAVAAMRLDSDEYKDIELPFADTQNIPSWAVNYIKAAFSNGWINGKSSSSGLLIDATANITREEAVTILYRIKAGTESGDDTAFIDNSSISHYAIDAITNFVANGIVNGYGDGSFKPINKIQRGEATKIIAEWINKILN